MAEVATALSKKFNRVTNKLILSKSERSSDQIFAEHITKFQKQQKGADRLLKEFTKYASCIKAAALAAKGYYEALGEVCEPDWPGIEHVKTDLVSADLQWEDFYEKLSEQVLNPLTSYNNRFPDVKAKIEKRSRKLLDYDGARHDMESKMNSAKRDDAKVAKLLHFEIREDITEVTQTRQYLLQKATEKFNETKRLFDEINAELMMELPQLFDERVPFYAANFQTYFLLEGSFHTDTGKLCKGICKEMDKLGEASLRPKTSDVSSGKDLNLGKGKDTISNTDNRTSKSALSSARAEDAASKDLTTKTSEEKKASLYPVVPSSNGKESPSLNPFESDDSPTSEVLPPVGAGCSEDEPNRVVAAETTVGVVSKESQSKSKSNEQNPFTFTDDESNVLYRLRATHKYNAEDTDELSFEAGEFISVIPFEADDEQVDDGWLLGIRESTGERGVFPANFTKPV